MKGRGRTAAPFLLSDFGFSSALSCVNKEVRDEQELSDDFCNCGAGFDDRVRDGGHLGQRLLHRRTSLHGLRRHEGRDACLRHDRLHPLRRHGHRTAGGDDHRGEYGYCGHLGAGNRVCVLSATSTAALPSSPPDRPPQSAASMLRRQSSLHGEACAAPFHGASCNASRDASRLPSRGASCGASSRWTWRNARRPPLGV